MSTINYKSRELNCKIVYYGPALCGKTTNLEQVHKISNITSKSELVSLNTEGDRTIFFDFLPLEIGTVRGFNVRLHLYTVPGQVIHNTTRKIILQGVDGVVFVADSSREKMSWNIKSLENLRDNLNGYGYNLDKLPYVLQLNKRDLPDAMAAEAMRAALQFKDEPVQEAIAMQGLGVFDTLITIARLVMRQVRASVLDEGKEQDSQAAHETTQTEKPS